MNKCRHQDLIKAILELIELELPVPMGEGLWYCPECKCKVKITQDDLDEYEKAGHNEQGNKIEE